MVRTVSQVFEAKPVIEGAGVRLKRIFGYNEAKMMDPFLMLDHFGSDNPEDYVKGFPWHPHRGIETVTYMIEGIVEHGDSLGNRGTIGSGDIQWMTAGSGIIHQEMPQPYSGTSRGFQLWVNLPATDKMMPPRYRDVAVSSIPEINADGARVKVICGEYCDVKGPVTDIVQGPTYIDVSMPANTSFQMPVAIQHTAFAYIFEGDGIFGADAVSVYSGQCAVFGEGDRVIIATTRTPLRAIVATGKPLKEPIAWRGPIVMNTQEELDTAFEEYSAGTFIRK